MTHAEPYRPPDANVTESSTTSSSATVGPIGLHGWLILVGMDLFVSPFSLLFFAVQTYLPMFRDGTWEALTTPGSEAYSDLWAPLLMAEMAGNGMMVLASILLVALFLRCSRHFPRIYILVSVAGLLFVLGDAWAFTLVAPDEPVFSPETAKEVGRGLAGIIIWVPYMLVSVRVRNTFVG